MTPGSLANLEILEKLGNYLVLFGEVHDCKLLPRDLHKNKALEIA